MKITAIYGAMPNYDCELGRICKRVYGILGELGVTVKDVSLAYEQIPYFDGVASSAAEDIMRHVESSDGIIFATTAMLYQASSVITSFLEYFMLPDFQDSIRGKNCMLLVTSHLNDERYVIEMLSRVVNRLGAFDSVKIGLSAPLIKTLDEPGTIEILEKQTEDFYRIIRQNRKFFIPGDTAAAKPPTVATPIDGLSKSQYEVLQEVENRQKQDISQIYQKLGPMTHKQEQDIDEITQYFSKKVSYPAPEPKPVTLSEPLPTRPIHSVAPRTKTCKQMTQSMPHYFQPQIAAGFSATLQLIISGAEKFDACITVSNGECQYSDGTADAPDITILSDSGIWMDVLTGKCTAQKAFMIGNLKVRGNFVILTKLDQFFKPMS